ncbi:MAG: class I SAM-dependent methyltransferase [Pseudodesulfovibrio sp.]|uniref:Methyltransferase type 11 n=1 Tax=Pseudodesulfovibrio aespoeensis (strain ATCC 700646 / DSM 10631 / Aspo-2) TaxID=643562 RepID=E6VVU3_PSEA9|nr:MULTISPECIES: class I SAM-dependent methyltransferase [Pseudodesulfovibrio]MBU4192946.1 class I SAM-dependent methyltransferase [Pseudomonadota bacterium]ADU61295.1 Methyltransferase type 11 [Pseudodesulfovibrio aespoeensis Aspo-2]MBU4243923.1 class I SAM-dependent methyltransferase [Pseudomonadota bacterium]MBU4379340.1 class I SAM-dependent methyltransferase [Pseudomonadota bacterium]MBU4476754.1 class I SAM-dependent methyltransferase [Pseudomonadota bacterium]
MTDMRELWNSLNKESEFNFISHLQNGQEWDKAEFHLTGIRFVDRMADRIVEYGTLEPSRASVLEIGCGVGRFLKPLACRFRLACGVDISEEMLKSAATQCSCLPNIVLQLTDGRTLNNLIDNSFDYCVSAGVFQHITDFEAIASYMREALRVLKPDGLFLLQFEGNRKEEQGQGQTGAKITAAKLDAALAGAEFQILEVSADPTDAVRNIVLVLRKTPGQAPVDTFKTYPMTKRRWMEGVYDDIKTKTQMHERQAAPPLTMTFYDA